MVGQGCPVSYGCNVANYISGETMSKEHPEKIFRIYDNLLSPLLNGVGIYDTMKLHVSQFASKHPKLKNDCIQIILSPAKENVANFTEKDWRELWLEFVSLMDQEQQFLRKDKAGNEIMGKTNFAESMHTVWLHCESKGGTPHLHALCSALDIHGNINDAHKIGKRVQKVTAMIAERRGWRTAMDIHMERAEEIAKDCIEVLNMMQNFDLKDYFRRLERYGYSIKHRQDKQGIIRAYSIGKEERFYKASELGKGRHFTVQNLEKTWVRLHEQQRKFEAEQKAYRHAVVNARRDVANANPSSFTKQGETQRTFNSQDYSRWFDGAVRYSFYDNHAEHTCYIPKAVEEYYNKEFSYTNILNWKELKDLAVQVFVGYIDEATTIAPSVGGGSSTSDLPRRDQEEDDINWAKRCAAYARSRKGVTKKRGYRY